MNGLTKPVTKARHRQRRCPCGRRFNLAATGRPRRFCSDACRQRAHRRKHTAKPAVWHRRQSDEWATPRDRFDEWDREFGPFTLDVAATAENAMCEQYFTIQDDGLAREWTGTVWCNPPYSSVGRWVEKAYASSLTGTTVVCLVPARTDTRWWHQFAEKGEVRFIKGRLRFSEAKSVAPFPSALLVFRPNSRVRVARRGVPGDRASRPRRGLSRTAVTESPTDPTGCRNRSKPT